MNEPVISRINPFILALACLVILLMGSIGRDLWTPDEPRVAAISLEMSRTGEYMIPHLAGKPFVEKPPLYFAVAAGAIDAVGRYTGNLNAIRLVTVLFGIGTLLMTFLLARRLYGKEEDTGILAAIILATMFGFVENFHWIRVDAALCFFVMAAVWSFSEVYLAGKGWYCLPAGLFTAGAFLSKGPIGPVLIAIPWFVLYILWLTRSKQEGDSKTAGLIGQHLLGILVFILFSGAWVLYLKLKGGPELWHKWFWVNQVGRLTGTSPSLGHIRTGRPFYYIFQVAGDTSPWFPLVIAWICAVVANFIKHRRISRQEIFLLAWAAGTLLLLTLSATKRGIYSAPLIPAFALMCVPALKTLAKNKWVRGYGYFWIGLCFVLLALLAVVPFVTPDLPHKIPAKALAVLGKFGWPNIVSAAAALFCLYLFSSFRNRQKAVGAMILATIFVYIGLLIVPIKAVDAVKSMRSGILHFTDRIPVEMRPHIAGYSFDETMLGCFYFYADWTVPQIHDKVRVNRIVAEADPRYDSIIISRHAHYDAAMKFIKGLVTVPYRIIEEQYTGDRSSRGVFWIEGAGPSPRPTK